MNFLLILTLFINYLCINGAPVSVTSVYDAIKQSANDPKLNCTTVRNTLIEPQATFLKKCLYNGPTSADEDQSKSTELCLLYYSNVMSLCQVSINFPQLDVVAELKEEANVHQDLAGVCATIVKETKSFVYEEVKEPIELTLKKLNPMYCGSLCLMPDLRVKPECILNAFMLKMLMTLNTKSYKPLHTVKDVPETPELHQESHQETHVPSTNTAPKTEPLLVPAPQSHNDEVKSDTQTTKGTSDLQVSIEDPAVTVEKKTEQNDDQSKQAPDGKPPIENPPSKLPGADPVNGGTLKVDDKNEISPSQEEVGASKKSETAADKSATNHQPKPNPNNQEQENTNEKKNPKEVSQEKSVPNPQEDNIEKIPVTKTDAGKISEEHEEVNPESDLTFVGVEKQVTNEKIEENQKVSEKSQLENSVAKEETPPDLGGDGDDLTGAINEGEEYPDAPELPLDNSGVPEVIPGNSAAVVNENPKSSEVKTKVIEKVNNKPQETNEDEDDLPANYQNQSIDDSDSYFFSYFMMVCIMFICGYVAYHNKQKILALVVEGRRGRRTSRTRRPNSANYRKLDSNLEEAVTSSCNKNTTQIIY